MSKCYDNPEYDDLGNGLQNTWEQFRPKQSIKDRILSETSEEIKQRVRDNANRLVMKQETLEEAGVAYAKTVDQNHTSHMLGFLNGAKWQQERSYSEEAKCECGQNLSCECIAELEPLEVPMPIYNNEELTYEEDLVKKIAVVLLVGNEAQAERLIEKYVQYRLEPFEELVNNWRQKQIHYEDVAAYNVDNQHTNRKFTYKAMATRDCWKELLTLINK